MDAEAARELFRRFQKIMEDLWIERQAFRKIILDANAISESDLEKVAEDAKTDPHNRKLAAQNFASSHKTLALFGIEDAIRSLPTKPPAKDKQN